MITSLDVKQNDNGTTHVKYTASFTGTSHICYGDFDATSEEATNAFKAMTNTDMWAGFKKLVLTRLKTEATNALGGVTNE